MYPVELRIYIDFTAASILNRSKASKYQEGNRVGIINIATVLTPNIENAFRFTKIVTQFKSVGNAMEGLDFALI